jgi:hypothetical protein
MSTYSTNLKIEEIGTGEQAGTWGTTTNDNFVNVFEEAIVGRVTVPFSNADVTLTATNSVASQSFRNVYLNCTGTNAASRNLIVPTINKNYVVQNNTTGGFSIVVKTVAGTGITVPNGASCTVYVDGTNVIQAFNYLPSLIAGDLTDPSLTATRVIYAGTGGNLVDSANLTFDGTTLTSGGYSTGGNLTFTSTGNRIRGDFSNATVASRVAFQTSTANSPTIPITIPNGTGTFSGYQFYNNSDPTNAGCLQVGASTSVASVISSISGTGTYLPLTMWTGGIERLRIDTSGNLLLGTSTSPTTTTVAGSMSIAGYGIYGVAGANGAANTTQNYGISYQNTNLNTTGAANVSLIGINLAPQASHDATSGTNSLILRGVIGAPQITSSAATAVLNYAAITGTANRTYSTDTSSSASNTTIGLASNFGHASTLSTSAVSAQAIGVQTNGVISSGSATSVYGVLNTGSFNPTTGTVSSTNRYGFFDGSIPVGNSTGTATITNWYGVYLNAPNVGANGTITNRWGVYQADTAGANYFGANVGIGTTTPITNLTIATAGSPSSASIPLLVRGGNAGVGNDGGGIAFSTSTGSAITSASQAATAIRSLNSYASESNGEQGDLAFYTNQRTGTNTYTGLTERMRITAAGDVGIGTNSPATYGKLTVQNATTSTITAVATGTGVVSTLLASNNAVGVGVMGTSSNHPLLAITNGTEKMRITSAGFVGIGTSAPPNNLTVWGSGTLPSALANCQLLVGDTSGFANAGLGLVTSAGNASSVTFGSTASPTLGRIEYDNTNNYMRFYTNSSERMRISTSGSDTLVGISIATPTLNTSGTVLQIHNNTASRAAIIHMINAESGSGAADGLICGKWSDGTNYFFDYDSNPILLGTNGGNRMRIDGSTGLVGIGGSLSVGSLSGAIRAVNFFTTEMVMCPATAAGTNVFFNICNDAGNNGSSYALTIRGLASSGSAQATLSSVNIDATTTNVNTLSKTGGSFRIDHPLPELNKTHDLVHSFVESPDANNIYRGVVTLTNGQAMVNLDEVSRMTEGTFVLLNRETQAFVSNQSDWDAVKASVNGNTLTIQCQNTQSTASVSWLVIGMRKDKYMFDTDWTDDNGYVITEPLKRPESQDDLPQE